MMIEPLQNVNVTKHLFLSGRYYNPQIKHLLCGEAFPYITRTQTPP